MTTKRKTVKQDRQLVVAQVAERLGIRPSTWRAYVARGQAPAADGRYDARTPWWWESTVDAYAAGTWERAA